jgi:hypothetical protein
MDRVPDSGIQWRENITPFLRELGIVVLNPCSKPIDVPSEIENRALRQQLKNDGNYDELSKLVKRDIRIPDLRMVDMSDVVILNLDVDVHMCGSYEEVTTANRQKNPILVRCAQGKRCAPDWMFSMIPHQHIFDNWQDLKAYMCYINDKSNQNVETYKRWQFFRYEELLPWACQESMKF